MQTPFKAQSPIHTSTGSHLWSTLTNTNVALGADEVVAELRVDEGGTGSSSSNKGNESAGSCSEFPRGKQRVKDATLKDNIGTSTIRIF